MKRTIMGTESFNKWWGTAFQVLVRQGLFLQPPDLNQSSGQPTSFLKLSAAWDIHINCSKWCYHKVLVLMLDFSSNLIWPFVLLSSGSTACHLSQKWFCLLPWPLSLSGRFFFTGNPETPRNKAQSPVLTPACLPTQLLSCPPVVSVVKLTSLSSLDPITAPLRSELGSQNILSPATLASSLLNDSIT